MNGFLLLWLAALFFVSCSDDGNETPVVDATVEQTVLVWIAGDNNLSSEVPCKIDALCQGYLNANPKSHSLLSAAFHQQLLNDVTAANRSSLLPCRSMRLG